MTAEEATKFKDEGNQLFKDGNYEDALSRYTQALQLNPGGGSETAVYYKNRAACFLKLEKYGDAAKDASAALELTPNDPKALFRRCQALEQMGKHEDAYKDAAKLLTVDPKNTAVQAVLRKLTPIIQDKVKQQSSTDSRVSQMFDLTFNNAAEDTEKRKQAANNLIVLAREESGANKIYKNGGVPNLIKMMADKDPEFQLTAIRVLSCLAGNSKERAISILDQVGLPKIALYIGMDSDDISTAMAHLVQNILTSATQLDAIKSERDKFETKRKADVGSKLRPFPHVSEKIESDGIQVADRLFPMLIQLLKNGKVSAFGRDNAMELIIKFVTRKDGAGWSNKFIAADGLQAVLEVAGTIMEHKSLPISGNARMHASLALSKVYEDLIGDAERDAYREKVDVYFQDMFGDNILESKLEAIMALAALLQGPFEVGNAMLGRAGIMDLILTMANSGDAIHTKYAVEALVHSASKKDRCSGVIKQATPILKELYKSNNDYIKVRALVGLCKLGSFGGSDASAKTFAEGSTQMLAKACRKFLNNPTKDVDLRKWAAEGLAYLTLDAEVKEELISDTDSIRSLLDLAKVSDKGVLYPVATILTNVTNSHDKKEVEPELIELAKFAQHHIPEDHEKDKDSYVRDRRRKLVALGIVPALVALSKTESENSRELIARVFLACVDEVEHRGLVVQQGGAKVLLPLSLDNTPAGKWVAAQALAKIAIVSNPQIAFPGERACEVVRPLLSLLNVERTALQNFEGLMALTNMASMNDYVRKRILKERGFPFIEHYVFEEHEDLQRAAMECICNMIMNEEVVETFKGENDRLKMLVLFAGYEDERMARAAAGGLAMLTAEPELCFKFVTCTSQWCDILQFLAAHEIPDIQHRGIYILRNMLSVDKELATKLVEGPLLEILMAVSRLDDPSRQAARQCAVEALDQAVEWELIKPIKDTALTPS